MKQQYFLLQVELESMKYGTETKSNTTLAEILLLFLLLLQSRVFTVLMKGPIKTTYYYSINPLKESVNVSLNYKPTEQTQLFWSQTTKVGKGSSRLWNRGRLTCCWSWCSRWGPRSPTGRALWHQPGSWWAPSPLGCIHKADQSPATSGCPS